MYQIAWQPSHLTEYKLNIDGAFSSNTSMAGINALIRDSTATLIIALAAI